MFLLILIIRFERGAISGSINIPFTSVQLAQVQIDSLGPQAKPLSENKDSVVVIIGPNEQNNFLVSIAKTISIRFISSLCSHLSKLTVCRVSYELSSYRCLCPSRWNLRIAIKSFESFITRALKYILILFSNI